MTPITAAVTNSTTTAVTSSATTATTTAVGPSPARDTSASAAASNQPYPRLATPIEIGGVRLRHRIAHAAITTRYVSTQQVTDRLLAYHAERARGGCAMIVTEPLAVLSWQKDEGHRVRAFDDSEHDGLQRWAAAVEAHDCRLLGQIQDAGRGMHNRGRKAYCLGASALPDDLSWTVPHAMSTDQVAAAVDEIAGSARRLQRAGFSGVEISAGHGHLFHQFLSPAANHRVDRYGGDADGRLRFLSELLQAISAATTRPFIVAVKLPGDDGVAGGIGPDLAEAILRRVAALGVVDAFAFAQGAHHRSLESHIPDLHAPRACYDPLVKRLRASAGGVPVAALGRLLDADLAEHALADGVGDYVQIGRPMITDAAWATHALAGTASAGRQCVSCNTCWGLIADKHPIACDNNPRVGTPGEAQWQPVPALRRKKIVVVGAGVAGLETAWLAARRGHGVTVFGAGQAHGGGAGLLARIPGMDQVSSVHDFQYAAGRRAGVRYEFGLRATAEDVVGLSPDEVVLATGARMTWPAVWPDEWRAEGWVHDLRATAVDVLRPTARQPGTAVLIDQDQTAGTYAAAALLAQRFAKVVIATPRTQLAHDEPTVVQQSIYRRLSALPVQVLPLMEPAADADLGEGWITLRQVYSGAPLRIDDVALLTYATARTPTDELAAPLRAVGLPLHLIGDCYSPRQLLNATAEGHALGNRL